jgi:hypothetical protein
VARATAAPLIPDGPVRDADGRAFQSCPAAGCRSFPVDPITGATTPVPERKWWCSAHRHLAGLGDLEAWRPRVTYGPSGSLIDLDEIEREAAQQAVAAQRRADELEQRRAQRAAAWPELEAERVAQAALVVGANVRAQP